MMKADKTRTNPAIDQELKNLGRTAVPVNALYLPGRKPVVTRELLSPAYLLEFLERKWNARTSCHADGNPPPSPQAMPGSRKRRKLTLPRSTAAATRPPMPDNPSPLNGHDP